MAIQVSGTEVISNARALNNIASVDATTAAAITAAGVGGGGTVDLTADGSISSGNVVGISGNGTVSTTAPLFGPISAFSSASRVYSSGYWDQATNKVVVASADSAANNMKIRVGTIASNGAISWGTEQSYGGYINLNNICVAMHNNVGLVSFTASNWGNYRMMRSFGVSGTTVNSTSGDAYLDGDNDYSAYGNARVQTLMADPNNSGKFVQVYQGTNVARPRAAIITATGNSASSTHYQIGSSVNQNCTKMAIAYNPTSGKFMGTWTGNALGTNTVTAASLTVSGSALSIGTVITSLLTQSSDQVSMAYSSTNGNFLYFVRDSGGLYGWVLNTDGSGNATSFGSANYVVNAPSTDWYARNTYNSSGVTTVGAWQAAGGNSKLYLISDTAGGVVSVSGEPIDISTTAPLSSQFGGPWGLQDKGTFISFEGSNSPYNSSEINTASTYFTALGVSEGNYTNGQTATVTITGGITNAISSLVAGQNYQPSSSSTGGLVKGGSFAVALDTNKLLIK